MKDCYVICVLMILACLAAPVALAQSTDATLSGVVVDPSGKVIPHAFVEILNEATGRHFSSETNEVGIYTVSILPPGQYRLQVSKTGFKTIIKPDILLNVESALALNFTLPLGAASETVTVDAATSGINTTDAAVSAVVDQQFVENMPLNGRSIQDLISMTPGVVTQSPQAQGYLGGSSLGVQGDFSVNGQRTESNYYMVDGVSVNTGSGNGFGYAQPAGSGSLASSTALGTTQSLVSVDALQEFRLQSSTYSAEYGRTPGGEISLLTRSGTNEAHGTAFDYLRNDYFDANDWFNDRFGKPISALRQNDFGASFGAPIIVPHLYDGRNRSFIFVSYEGLRLVQPQGAGIQYVPDLFMRQQAPLPLQAILNAYPLPTSGGLDYGSDASPSLAQFIQGYSLPSRIDSTSVRVDHALTSKLALFFRFGDTPSSASNRNLSSLTQAEVRTRTYTLGANGTLSNLLSNEFRLGYASGVSEVNGALDGFGGATPTNLATAFGSNSANPETSFYISIPQIGISSLDVARARSETRQWNFVDTVALSRGRHQLKFGIDYRRIKSPMSPATPLVEGLYFNTESILGNKANVLLALAQEGSEPILDESSAFIQDEWRLSPRLNLSMGLRWELDPPPTGANGNDAYTLSGDLGDINSFALARRGTPLWKTAWYNFAPRLGAAWRIRQDAAWGTVLRTGGGVYFDTDNEVGIDGFSAFGFTALGLAFGAPLPAAPALVNIAPSTDPPYTSAAIYAFPHHLQPPYALEWNASVEQALGAGQTMTASYVGSAGRRLVQRQERFLQSLNPTFGTVYYVTGGVTSNYQALQMKFEKLAGHGLHTLASYTWSHSIDFGSNDAALPLTRGNSDFDVRHNLAAGISWDLPGYGGGRPLSILLNRWGLDARVMSRTGFPVTLYGKQETDPASGGQFFGGLDRIAGQRVYLDGAQYPGRRIINSAAFRLPASGSVGDAPRNFVRGFAAAQLNGAVRREFRLHEPLTLQFRAEAFNILNHPNFGYVDATYTDATFGQATQMLNQSLGTVNALYQQGGPRSMQFALRFKF